jgi:hypothetical protein
MGAAMNLPMQGWIDWCKRCHEGPGLPLAALDDVARVEREMTKRRKKVKLVVDTRAEAKARAKELDPGVGRCSTTTPRPEAPTFLSGRSCVQ